MNVPLYKEYAIQLNFAISFGHIMQCHSVKFSISFGHIVAVKKNRHEKYLIVFLVSESRHVHFFILFCFSKSGHCKHFLTTSVSQSRHHTVISFSVSFYTVPSIRLTTPVDPAFFFCTNLEVSERILPPKVSLAGNSPRLNRR